MPWETIVKILHIIGTVLGVGGATFAEIFYFKLRSKAIIDPITQHLLRATYTTLRVGLVLLVTSGFGYLLLLRFEGQAQYIYSPRVWVKLLITAIILVNALLLQSRKIPMWLGTSISLTSWYAALVIGAWRMHANFAMILGVYVLAIFVVSLIKGLISKLTEGGET